MQRQAWLLALAAMLAAMTACSDEVIEPAGGDCNSFYEDIATADTRRALNKHLTSKVDPSIVSLRIQGTGTASGEQRQPAEFVDLLNARKRRVMQIEVFRLDDGRWYAGQWQQCID